MTSDCRLAQLRGVWEKLAGGSTQFFRGTEAAQCLQSCCCLRCGRLVTDPSRYPGFPVLRNSELGRAIGDSVADARVFCRVDFGVGLIAYPGRYKTGRGYGANRIIHTQK